ncbi:MAG: hypothetical protein KC776_38525 [Myxococcales bacterium]|nr:hypothetical protein [Myxococcales bacterium]MCB9576229.1 hypothetical protein [Polyangiaceae bacterium]
MRVTFCDRCGAPLDAAWTEIVVVCQHCGAHNAPGKVGEPVPATMPDDGRPRLNVGGRTYVLEGRIGAGDACDVYRGRWVKRLGELCVIKVQRALSDSDLLRREWAMLERLHASSTPGAEHFTQRLPRMIAMGQLHLEGHDRLILVYGWRSGFVHTLEDVDRVHPDGVDARIATWIFKRQLELLGWVHTTDVMHGAIVPPHVLIHPRDHGATLVGWSAATTRPERLPAISRKWKAFYPEPVLKHHQVVPRADIAMAARVTLAVTGAKRFDESGKFPGALGRLMIAAAAGRFDSAWSLRDDLDQEALSAFGPPTYSPLQMPGWPATAQGA